MSAPLAAKIVDAVIAVIIAVLLGSLLFIESTGYARCHATAEDAGYVPHFDPVTLKCRVSLL